MTTLTITINVHQCSDCLPDADTDVLVWESGESEAQLGALYRTCPLEWVNAQGAPIRVVAWAALPVLREERALTTITGQRIDLADPWRVPNVRAEAPTPAPERTR